MMMIIVYYCILIRLEALVHATIHDLLLFLGPCHVPFSATISQSHIIYMNPIVKPHTH